MYLFKRIFGKAHFTLLVTILVVITLLMWPAAKVARIDCGIDNVCGTSYDEFDFSNYESYVY